MTKKLLLSLFSLFLAYRSFELIKYINDINPTEFSWFVKFIISIVLNLFITGFFAFLGFAFTTSRILPNWYYRVKDRKKLNNLYKFLGLKYFKTILLYAFWGKEKNRKKYFNGTKSGIDNFDTQTRQSEFGHLGAFIAILLVSLFLLLKGHLILVILTTIINLISNLYPIILQRTHRIQIERVINIKKQRNDGDNYTTEKPTS